MGFFNEEELLAKFTKSAPKVGESYQISFAEEILHKRFVEFKHSDNYDIFLSHSLVDARLIKALRDELIDMKLTVYVDWIDDSELERENVTKHHALVLRNRMGRCKCLFYAISEASKNSVWMPWELGFMDAHSGKVAILPIKKKSLTSDSFSGREYLGIYPYVKRTQSSLLIHDSETKWDSFRSWLDS